MLFRGIKSQVVHTTTITNTFVQHVDVFQLLLKEICTWFLTVKTKNYAIVKRTSQSSHFLVSNLNILRISKIKFPLFYYNYIFQLYAQLSESHLLFQMRKKSSLFSSFTSTVVKTPNSSHIEDSECAVLTSCSLTELRWGTSLRMSGRQFDIIRKTRNVDDMLPLLEKTSFKY